MAVLTLLSPALQALKPLWRAGVLPSPRSLGAGASLASEPGAVTSPSLGAGATLPVLQTCPAPGRSGQCVSGSSEGSECPLPLYGFKTLCLISKKEPAGDQRWGLRPVLSPVPSSRRAALPCLLAEVAPQGS